MCVTRLIEMTEQNQPLARFHEKLCQLAQYTQHARAVVEKANVCVVKEIYDKH